MVSCSVNSMICATGMSTVGEVTHGDVMTEGRVAMGESRRRSMVHKEGRGRTSVALEAGTTPLGTWSYSTRRHTSTREMMGDYWHWMTMW